MLSWEATALLFIIAINVFSHEIEHNCTATQHIKHEVVHRVPGFHMFDGISLRQLAKRHDVCMNSKEHFTLLTSSVVP